MTSAVIELVSGDDCLRTSGRFRVRDILASVDGSYSMLRALAEAEHSVVPVVRNRRVSGDREGASAREAERKGRLKRGERACGSGAC